MTAPPSVASPPHPASEGLRGVLPVLETAFLADERVDYDGFGRIVDHTLGLQVSGVMFPGFASEFSKLREAERRELGLIVLERTRGRSDRLAILSVPDHATDLAVEQAEWAVDQGADAINVLPPYFLAPSRQLVVAHLSAILEAIPETPVIVQLAPGLTGASLSASDVAELAQRFGNLAAVKVEAVPPGPMVSTFGRTDPPLPCLVGYGGVSLPDALRRGAVGVQPGCSATELYVSLWNLWTRGAHDEFHALHRRMLPYLVEWMQHPEYIVQAEKTVSARRGWITSDFCRAPGFVLDEHQSASVERFLVEFSDELGL